MNSPDNTADLLAASQETCRGYKQRTTQDFMYECGLKFITALFIYSSATIRLNQIFITEMAVCENQETRKNNPQSCKNFTPDANKYDSYRSFNG